VVGPEKTNKDGRELPHMIRRTGRSVRRGRATRRACRGLDRVVEMAVTTALSSSPSGRAGVRGLGVEPVTNIATMARANASECATSFVTERAARRICDEGGCLVRWTRGPTSAPVTVP
jgi:hypothetical protein